MAYLLRLFVCLATTNQPDTPLLFNSLNTRFGYNSLRNGTPYKNFRGGHESQLTLKANVKDKEGADEEVYYNIALYKGRNHGNIGCERSGDYLRLGASVTDPINLFSIYVPGLAGVPQVEELRAKAIVRKGVASGDANLYLRNIIYYIKEENKLKELNEWLSSVFYNATVSVQFSEASDSYINVKVRVDGKTVPLELAGTGILQILQIISYVTYFNPKLLLLDEPDSHLHPNNQVVLTEVLQRISEETATQIILCTHSRHIVDTLFSQANFIWMKNGSVQEQGTEIQKLPILLDMGALDDFDKLKAGIIKSVILTEDRNTKFIELMLEANGFNIDEHLIYSYKTSSNLEGASLFVDFLRDVANGCKVIIHRDRDFMTEAEVDRIKDRIISANALPYITKGSDIESYFTSPEHISYCIEEDLDCVAGWLDDLAQTNHIEVQHQFTRKRDDIKNIMYRGNTQDCPDTLVLMGTDVPLAPEKRKGKYMLKRIRGQMHEKFKKSPNIIKSSEHIRDNTLQELLRQIEETKYA